MNHAVNWVVGAGGLLGSSVCGVAPQTETVWVPQRSLNWNSRESLAKDLSSTFSEFIDATIGHRWRIWWCAGKGTVSSSREILDDELTALTLMLRSFSQLPKSWREKGQVIFSSSAGSIYAGSSDLVIGPNTAPAPVTDYGMMKFRAETILREVGSEHGVAIHIARITNLYGPKQDMSKSQGLISTVCASVIRREPIPIFVSLGTVRNYIHARDAARLMWKSVLTSSNDRESISVVCSPANLSVGNILKIVEDVVGQRVLTRTASRPDSPLLSKSVFFDPARFDLALHDYTPVPIGVDEVYSGLLDSWQRGLMASRREVA